MNSAASRIQIYPNSTHTGQLEPDGGPVTFFLAQDLRTCQRVLGVRPPAGAGEGGGAEGSASLAGLSEPLFTDGDEHYFAANPANAALLRRVFPWLNPIPLTFDADGEMQPSFGFGDRLGLATPGHIQSMLAAGAQGRMAPIFAQQSVRENARTGRTPQEVMDDATWGVFQEGWRMPWGADADHLKQTLDLPAFVQAGYTFFTIDPGDHVDPAADSDPVETLQAKAAGLAWDEVSHQPIDAAELAARYGEFCAANGWDAEPDLTVAILRAQVKYGRAAIHIAKMYRALLALKPGGFDLEASVDETETPTSVLEHFYIASELQRMDVRFTSLAPRFPGRFEKGVDYIGDLDALDAELARHAAVMRYIGGYKLSLHSGSDKFSVYPLFIKYAGRAAHVKTAGTSYLEALRVAANLDPALFRQAAALARQRYAQERLSYHVSADEQLLPDPAALTDDALPALLDDFHVRQALHVTFGSALSLYGQSLKDLLCKEPQAYEQALVRHFGRHLDLLL